MARSPTPRIRLCPSASVAPLGEARSASGGGSSLQSASVTPFEFKVGLNIRPQGIYQAPGNRAAWIGPRSKDTRVGSAQRFRGAVLPTKIRRSRRRRSVCNAQGDAFQFQIGLQGRIDNVDPGTGTWPYACFRLAARLPRRACRRIGLLRPDGRPGRGSRGFRTIASERRRPGPPAGAARPDEPRPGGPGPGPAHAGQTARRRRHHGRAAALPAGGTDRRNLRCNGKGRRPGAR